MFDNFKVKNYPKVLFSPEMDGRHLSRLFSGDVIDGLTVVAKSGFTVTLQPGNAFIRYGSGASASSRLFSLLADFDITLDTADVSNPRKDLIVVYIDNAVDLPSGVPTSANLDGPGVVKAKFVKGTPAASPVAPNSTAIAAAVGASNQYFVVAEITVDKQPNTVIASNKILDKRSLAKLGSSSLDWATMTIGYAQKVAPQNQASTSTNAITDLSTTVVVPDGGCDLKITIWIGEISATGINTPVISLRDGASTIAYWRQTIAASGYFASASVIYKGTFAAGSHTFAAFVGASAATSFTIAAAAGNPAFILVERA